jgi:CheY-like chemotaxis protein
MQQKSVVGYSTDEVCLIIEDSEFDQLMMSRVIGRLRGRMRVKVANSLQAAREALAQGRVSLILLDNNLPDGIGANFAMELASDPNHSRTPVIMVSDWPTPFMWEKAAAAGVLYVVNKAEFGIQYVEHALKSRMRKQPLAS